MEEVVALDAEITRIVQSPLIVHRHLCCMVDLAHRTLLETLLQLECHERVFRLVLCVLGVDQPHVPNRDHVLAVPLKMCRVLLSETWGNDLLGFFFFCLIGLHMFYAVQS